MFLLKEKIENGVIYIADTVYVKYNTGELTKKDKFFNSIWSLTNKNIYDVHDLPNGLLIGDIAQFDNHKKEIPCMALIDDLTGCVLNNIPHKFVSFYENELYGLQREREREKSTIVAGNLIMNEFDQKRILHVPDISDWVVSNGNIFYTPFYIMDSDSEKFVIMAVSLVSGDEVWRFNTSELGDPLPVRRIYGVYRDILVVNIGESITAGIDANTGKLLWKSDIGTVGFRPNNKSDFLYALRSIQDFLNFIIIDVKTGELQRHKYEGKDCIIESQRDNNVVLENYLITTDRKKGKIGAFNISTHQFDWIWEEAGTSFPGGFPMQYFDPYLFVSDKDHTVYVFEKTI